MMLLTAALLVAVPAFDATQAAFTGAAVKVDFTAEPRAEEGLAFLDRSPETKAAPATVRDSRAESGSGYAYFRFTAPAFQRGATPLVRLSIEYLDAGHGMVSIAYDSSDPNVSPGANAGVWKSRHLALLRNSGQWRQLDVIVDDLQATGRCNGGDFRLDFQGAPWTLRRVTATAASAGDEEADRAALAGRAVLPLAAKDTFTLSFDQVLAKLAPYAGPSAHAKPVDTLLGKVVCGYQGWFATPGDGSGMGWVHLAEHSAFEPGDCHIEYWPDTSELADDEKTPTLFHKADGSTAYVFSSYRRPTVLRHFKWMADYGLDGAFVQRFAGGLRSPIALNKNNTVLTWVREGANTYGRSYNVMYDLSGGGDCGDLIIADWKNLVDRMKLTRDPADKAYQRHRGKPVVTLWGLFADRAEQHAAIGRIMDFLQHDPVYGGNLVMLGVANDWRTNASPAGQAMLHLCERADMISPWMVGRFGNPEGARAFIAQHNLPDQKWCDERGKDYLPVIFPGFSWHNMHDGLEPMNPIPRLKGRFLWTQATAAKAAGAKMFYVAMFDEMDEGTAIFKCDPHPPVGATKFLDFEGLPSDQYLWLAGEVGKMLRGEIPAGPEPPTR
jgi:hypothetical protein